MHCFIFVSRIDDAEIVNPVISPTSNLAFTMGIDIITGGFQGYASGVLENS